MKIIDAVWEKRNLGVDCVEIECFEHDEPDKLEDVLKRISISYSVVKVPAGSADLLFAAQTNGYRVVESVIELSGDMRKIKTPKVYERFLPFVRIEHADDMMLESVLNDVRNGKVFLTDRIAKDPLFSAELAGRRYYYWCKDAIEQGAYMSVSFYKDQPVAFNLSQMKSCETTDSLLGGVLPETANKGMGFLLVHSENEICKLLGGKICIGRVSSNNLPILRLHMQYGYDIKKISYVLVKHNSVKKEQK